MILQNVIATYAKLVVMHYIVKEAGRIILFWIQEVDNLFQVFESEKYLLIFGGNYFKRDASSTSLNASGTIPPVSPGTPIEN